MSEDQLRRRTDSVTKTLSPIRLLGHINTQRCRARSLSGFSDKYSGAVSHEHTHVLSVAWLALRVAPQTSGEFFIGLIRRSVMKLADVLLRSYLKLIIHASDTQRRSIVQFQYFRSHNCNSTSDVDPVEHFTWCFIPNTADWGAQLKFRVILTSELSQTYHRPTVQ